MTTTTSEATIAANYALIDPPITANQATLVVGPDYVTRRYSNVAQRAALSLGSYTGSSSAVAWPGLLSGETVDQTFTSVTVENAAQRYYSESARPVADANSILTGYLNRIRISDRIFKTANGSTRSAQVPVDAAVGDWISLYNGTSTVVGKITKLIADIVLATTGAAAASSNNVATNAGTSGFANGGGTTSTAVGTIAGLLNQTNYHGEAARQISETYTITVTNVGAAGTGIAGNWSTVTLSCTSASGTDPAQTGLVPVVATPLSIGSRGARVQWSHGASGNDWVLGDTFTVTVTQTYTIPTPVAAGTFTGTSNTTYIATVTRGGLTNGAGAQVSITTSTGSDVSGPHFVTTGVAIPIGTKGVTFMLTGTILYANDVWTSAVTALTGGTTEVGGAIRTLEISTGIEATAALFTTNWVGQSITVGLAVLGTIALPQNRIGFAPLTNWSTSATLLTLNAGAITYTTRTGSLALTLVAGTAYATYRALRSANVGTLVSAMTDADLTALGFADPTDPDNILAHGFHRAFASTGTVAVKGMAVATNDSTGFQAIESAIYERPDWKTIVPLTLDTAIRDRFVTMVNTRSGNSYQLWSDIVVPVIIPSVVSVVVLRADSSISTATIIDDPLTGAADYTLVNDTLGQFITKAVRAGDQYRTTYTGDGFGNSTYTTYVVASVASETQLRLVAGPAAPVTLATRYEVWRTPTVAESVLAAGAFATAFANSRVIPVFPDTVVSNGNTEPGYYVAAKIAGLRSAAAPHQGLETVDLDGFDTLPSSATFAGQGYLLNQYPMYVIKQAYSGEVLIDAASTSASLDPIFVYDSVRRNLDACLWRFKGVFERFRGHSNITDENLSQLSAQFQAEINYIKTRSFVQALGSMILSGTLSGVRRHATIADKVVVSMSLTLPAPLDGVEFDIDVVI